jgi:hypothetical protein
MHGGRSTGPRTAEGLDRLRTARTVHGSFSAEMRALDRHHITALRRGRVTTEAARRLDRLPADFAARLVQGPPELDLQSWPSGGLTPAQDRAIREAEAAALAPWTQAIAEARLAWRMRGSRREGERPHAPIPGGIARPRGVDAPPAEAGADRATPSAVFFAPGEEPHAPVTPPGLDASVSPGGEVEATRAASAKPHAPVAPPGTDGPDRLGSPDGEGAAARDTAAEPHAPVPGIGDSPLPPELAGIPFAAEVWSQVGALLADGTEPHAPDNPPPMPGNRADRRRWKYLQKRAQRTLDAHRRRSGG